MSAPAKTKSRQRGGFGAGLVVGLLIGLALALAVALYVTKVPVPFIDKVPQRTPAQDAAEAERNKNWDPNAPLAGKTVRPVLPPPGPVTPPVVNAPGASPAPPATSTRDPAALLNGQPAPAPAAAASRPAGADPFTYFVQAGAFARFEDADQQRAKLAMLGLAARVTEREQSGRTVYRVRVGPYERRDEADTAQNRLQGAGVEASLVRVER